MRALRAVNHCQVQRLLQAFGIDLVLVAQRESVPGSYWGAPEAGAIGTRVYAQPQTPLHSLLHEAAHLIIAEPGRRERIHTDASESQLEEDATCLLQIEMSVGIPGFGKSRCMADMDAWGYSFRLGSACAWYWQDAEDARAFLNSRVWLVDWSARIQGVSGRIR
jgi:hypothetical protein